MSILLGWLRGLIGEFSQAMVDPRVLDDLSLVFVCSKIDQDHCDGLGGWHYQMRHVALKDDAIRFDAMITDNYYWKLMVLIVKCFWQPIFFFN